MNAEVDIRILLAEDDAELANRLITMLRSEGFVVDHAADGETGCHLGEANTYDAIVLDLELPHLSGIEILKRWRGAGLKMPVLVLTARNQWTDRVAGLNAGADDYLGKPFQSPELVARLRALIRRSAGLATAALRVDDIVLDRSRGTVELSGRRVEVTAREMEILEILMHRPGRIVSQSEIGDRLFPMDGGADSNTIEVHIARLRRKLGRDSIRTIRGLGYRMG